MEQIYDFPAMLDSTMRASFMSCPYKFYVEWIRRLKYHEESTDLVAGGAFAAGMEAARKTFYAQKGSRDDALHAGVIALLGEYGNHQPRDDNPKTPAAMIGALDAYLSNYPLDTDYLQPCMTSDGKPMVEFNFAFPIPGTVHPTTGDPVMYGGRCDMLGQFNNMVLVVDEKTTKQLGSRWANQWDLRGQFLGYTYAARHMLALPVVGALIRGVSILKRSYGFAESVVMINEWLLEKWINQLQRDVNRMIDHWQTNQWDQVFDTACNYYNGCPIKQVCLSSDPEPWLSQYFIRNEWNPLAKNPEKEKQV